MRELLRWLFNLNAKELDQATEALSKDTAKQRLKLVLIQDRLELAPEKLEDMKKEIWEPSGSDLCARWAPSRQKGVDRLYSKTIFGVLLGAILWKKLFV